MTDTSVLQLGRYSGVDLIDVYRAQFGLEGASGLLVHFIKVLRDLQNSFILGFRHVEPNEHAGAEAERKKDEEAEIIQMLLQGRIAHAEKIMTNMFFK